MKNPDIADWGESDHGFNLQSTKQPIMMTPYQRKIIRHYIELNKQGEVGYGTTVLSGLSKSGKTGMAIWSVLWFATQDSE